MTKKPIMIDGVDVSGCRHFNYGEGYNQETEEFVEGACECITAHDGYGEFMYYGICKGCDCYYKQLKRKEEENDQLKAEKETLEKDLAGFDAILETFKAQYKELKAEKINIENDFAVEIQARLFHTHKHLEYLELSNLYEQALQEIKEMCKLAPKQTTCDRCHTFGFPPEHELIKLILQKCEVIDE